MKFIKTFGVILLGVLSLTVIEGCKKDDMPIIEKTQKDDGSIALMKTYLSKLINVNVEDIAYNNETETFSVYGVDQVNKENLNRMLNQSQLIK